MARDGERDPSVAEGASGTWTSGKLISTWLSHKVNRNLRTIGAAHYCPGTSISTAARMRVPSADRAMATMRFRPGLEIDVGGEPVFVHPPHRLLPPGTVGANGGDHHRLHPPVLEDHVEARHDHLAAARALGIRREPDKPQPGHLDGVIRHLARDALDRDPLRRAPGFDLQRDLHGAAGSLDLHTDAPAAIEGQVRARSDMRIIGTRRERERCGGDARIVERCEPQADAIGAHGRLRIVVVDVDDEAIGSRMIGGRGQADPHRGAEVRHPMRRSPRSTGLPRGERASRAILRPPTPLTVSASSTLAVRRSGRRLDAARGTLRHRFNAPSAAMPMSSATLANRTRPYIVDVRSSQLEISITLRTMPVVRTTTSPTAASARKAPHGRRP